MRLIVIKKDAEDTAFCFSAVAFWSWLYETGLGSTLTFNFFFFFQYAQLDNGLQMHMYHKR